jgi:hypothetical protein
MTSGVIRRQLWRPFHKTSWKIVLKRWVPELYCQITYVIICISRVSFTSKTLISPLCCHVEISSEYHKTYEYFHWGSIDFLMDEILGKKLTVSWMNHETQPCPTRRPRAPWRPWYIFLAPSVSTHNWNFLEALLFLLLLLVVVVVVVVVSSRNSSFK